VRGKIPAGRRNSFFVSGMGFEVAYAALSQIREKLAQNLYSGYD
jgi:hypothetical protein